MPIFDPNIFDPVIFDTGAVPAAPPPYVQASGVAVRKRVKRKPQPLSTDEIAAAFFAIYD